MPALLLPHGPSILPLDLLQASRPVELALDPRGLPLDPDLLSTDLGLEALRPWHLLPGLGQGLGVSPQERQTVTVDLSQVALLLGLKVILIMILIPFLLLFLIILILFRILQVAFILGLLLKEQADFLFPEKVYSKRIAHRPGPAQALHAGGQVS